MVSCPASYSWANNINGNNPCEVASVLRRVCDSSRSELTHIGPGGQYDPPSRADGDSCLCSSVVYELVSACADCQGGTFSSWNDWKRQCKQKDISEGFFPHGIPTGAETPGWTYVNVQTNPTFDRVLAGGDPNLPSPQQPQPNPPSQDPATQNPNSTTLSDTSSQTHTPETTSFSTTTTAVETLTGTTATPTTTGHTQASFGADGRPIGTDVPNNNTGSANDPNSGDPQSALGGGKKNMAGPIAGGIIGGLILLVVLGLLVRWWVMRRRRMHTAPSAAYISAYGANRAPTSMSQVRLGSERTNSPLFSPAVTNFPPEVTLAGVRTRDRTYSPSPMRDSNYSTQDNRYSPQLHPVRQTNGRESALSYKPHQDNGWSV